MEVINIKNLFKKIFHNNSDDTSNSVANELKRKAIQYQKEVKQNRINKYYENTRKLIIGYCSQVAEEGKFSLVVSTTDGMDVSSIISGGYFVNSDIDEDTVEPNSLLYKLLTNNERGLILVGQADYDNLLYFKDKFEQDTRLYFEKYDTCIYNKIILSWGYSNIIYL